MCVSSGEVFSGPSTPHNGKVASLNIYRTSLVDHLIYRQDIIAFIMYISELQGWSKMRVSSGEVFSAPSSPHKGRMVSLDSQNPIGGPFDIYTRNYRVYHVQK